MGMPVKITDDLVVAARAEARAAGRTMTGQIEHWAAIGRAVELLVTHSELLGIKSLQDVFPAAPRREEVRRLLEGIVTDPDNRKEARALIHGAGRSVYETNPAYPGRIVRVSGDGTRTVGRFKNRQFVPDEALPR